MNIDKISSKYYVSKLEDRDIDAIYNLCKRNTLYYSFCPPMITIDGIREDMDALPLGKTKDDKYYLGYYKNNDLIAVIDLIDGYPNSKTLYIGFFMVDVDNQEKGIGSSIIDELCFFAINNNFNRIELAWVKGNPQAEHFWLKNQFIPIREGVSNTNFNVIVAQRNLDIISNKV